MPGADIAVVRCLHHFASPITRPFLGVRLARTINLVHETRDPDQAPHEEPSTCHEKEEPHDHSRNDTTNLTPGEATTARSGH